MQANLGILIVEDEEPIKEMLKRCLEMADYRVMEATDTTQAEKRIQQEMPDLLLLDWMLPGLSGIDYVQVLRKSALTAHLPIILLTARAEEESKIRGLDMGADDYVTKPFSPRELITRIKTVLRRGPLVEANAILMVRGLMVDTQSCQVTLAGRKLSLTTDNYQLLLFFMQHPRKVISRESLLMHVWGGDKGASDRSVDVQILRLRKILAQHGCDDLIHTVRGLGYQFR